MDITQSLDITRTTYRVADFLSWQRGSNLNLRPPFQRGSVWSAKAKSFFIDTVVRGFPVPLLFIQDKTDPRPTNRSDWSSTASSASELYVHSLTSPACPIDRIGILHRPAHAQCGFGR